QQRKCQTPAPRCRQQPSSSHLQPLPSESAFAQRTDYAGPPRHRGADETQAVMRETQRVQIAAQFAPRLLPNSTKWTARVLWRLVQRVDRTMESRVSARFQRKA